MEQAQQNQPLYWDKHRIPVNLTLILALGIAAWGLWEWWDLGQRFFGGGEVAADVAGDAGEAPRSPLIFALGIGVAIYTWVTNPRLYLVYADSLCIIYGKPRVKIIHFSNIAAVEMGSLATPDRLRVRPIKGRRQTLLAKDPEAFYEQLESALNAFRDANPEYAAPVAPDAVAVIDAPAATATTDAIAAPEETPPQSEADGDYYASESDAPESPTAETPDASPEDDTPPTPEHRPLY